MPTDFVISVMARDRVGIIADVTSALRELGGNLADLSQTVLNGYFTMILVASFPDGVAAAAVRRRLRAIPGRERFEIGIRPYRPPRAARVSGAEEGRNRYILTAFGPDKTGLVAALAEFLRAKQINIEDLSTLVREDIYWMFLTVQLPQSRDIGRIKADLQAAMDPVGVRTSLMHQSIFNATNEV